MAGSVGAYGAYLHDGSEYTGAYAEKMSIEVRGHAFNEKLIKNAIYFLHSCKSLYTFF